MSSSSSSSKTSKLPLNTDESKKVQLRINDDQICALHYFFIQDKAQRWDRVKKSHEFKMLLELNAFKDTINLGHIQRTYKDWLLIINMLKDIGSTLRDLTLRMIEGNCDCISMNTTIMISILSNVYRDHKGNVVNAFPDSIHDFFERCYNLNNATDEDDIDDVTNDEIVLINDFIVYYINILLKEWYQIWHNISQMEAGLQDVKSISDLEEQLLISREVKLNDTESIYFTHFFQKTFLEKALQEKTLYSNTDEFYLAPFYAQLAVDGE
jgi:hypothetical protein